MSTPNHPKAIILVRVSTDRQDTSRQITELRATAEAKGWEVVEVCEETITGSAGKSDRTGLCRAEELALAGKIQKVMVHEVSRLSRRPSVTHDFVETLESSGVSLFWGAQNMETLLPSGKRNPAAAMMLALMAEMARAETDTLRERIHSGLAEARRKGVKLGRKQGSVESEDDFLSKHRDLVKLVKAGQSVRNAAALSGKSQATVMKVRQVMGLKAA